MTLRRLVVRNTGVQMATTTASLGISFVTTAILSRYLGVEWFGKFNYLFAFFGVFLSLNDFGVNTIVVREVSQARPLAGEIIGAMLPFKVFLALVSLVAAWITIALMHFPDELRDGLRIFSLILPITALQLPALIYQVKLTLGRLALLTFLIKSVVGSLLLMGVVVLGARLRTLAAACVLAEGLFLLMVLADTGWLVRPVIRWDPKRWQQILRPSVTIGITGLFGAVINQVDFMLLERLTDMRQVGLFAAANKVINFLEAFPLMVMGTLYPVLSRYASAHPQRLRSLYAKSVLGMGAVALPMGLCITLCAPRIIRLLFGTQFLGAERGLAILIWATVCLYMAIVGGTLLISMGYERINLILNMFGAAISVALNLWLIPTQGFMGAAWAMAATYLFLLIGTSIMAHRILRRAEEAPERAHDHQGGVT